MAPDRPRDVDRAYVDELARPLVSHMGEPLDTMSVLAIAVQAALYEAWEQIEHGGTHLRMFDGTGGAPRGADAGVWMSEGEILAGKRIIRRVAEALDLMRYVPPEPDRRDPDGTDRDL